MLSKVFVGVAFLFCYIGYAQPSVKEQDTIIYGTYRTKEMLFHEVQLLSEELCLFVPPRPLFNSIKTCYQTQIENDFIVFVPELEHVSDATVDEVTVEDKEMYRLHQSFVNGKFVVVSPDQIQLVSANRPYFRNTYIDSLVGKNQLICAVKGKIVRIPADFTSFSEIEALYEKPKKIKVKKLDGKEGYEKYGAVGLRGVVEFYEKKKCNKKK